MRINLLPQANKAVEVISLSNAEYHSLQGKYFFGQTDIINFGRGYMAWGGLVNPASSGVNMFLNAYTITNFSSLPITAEAWLSGILPGKVKTSVHFAAGNQAMPSSSVPKVQIQNVSSISRSPSGGTYAFVRRVEPNRTLTKHDFQGMYIIPPGSSFILFFKASSSESVQTRVAFGWWEEGIQN